VMSRGKPVAVISAANAEEASKLFSRKTLIERLNRQPASGTRNWTRNDLYEV
jgi:antitoxin (DNA-binding transcriptional repressor) of toxin-antitoxin stability system